MASLFSRWRIGKGVSPEVPLPLTHAFVMEAFDGVPHLDRNFNLVQVWRWALEILGEEVSTISATWTAPNAIPANQGRFPSVQWKGKVWCLEKKTWTDSWDEFRGDLGAHLRQKHPCTAQHGTDPFHGLAWHLSAERKPKVWLLGIPGSGLVPEETLFARNLIDRIEAARLRQTLEPLIPEAGPLFPCRKTIHRL
jgi:hypothetical protein